MSDSIGNATTDVTLSRSLLFSLLAFVVCFGCCDGYLVLKLKSQDTLLASLRYENEMLSQAPTSGLAVPVVQGISAIGNKPLAVRLASSHQIMLLVFSTNCKFCEQNWQNWNDLFSKSNPHVPAYLLSSDLSMSQSYVRKHPLVGKLDTLIHVDPEVFQAFNVSSTPQTIYVLNGKVQRDWVGSLSTKDVNEISHIVAVAHNPNDL